MESESENLYCAEVTVIVKAKDRDEAEKKIRERCLIVDDIMDVKEEKLDHIKDLAFREKIRQKLLKELKEIEGT